MGQLASRINNHLSSGKSEHPFKNSCLQVNPHDQDNTTDAALPDVDMSQNIDTSIKYIDIINNADLVIQLTTPTGEVVKYSVSRKVMATASPVFAKMVDKDSRMPSVKKRKHSHTSISWCLELYDDDSEAMSILLWAIHGQKSHIPVKVTYEQLLALAHTVDKYDCVSAVSDWKGRWIKLVPQWAVLKETIKSGSEGWLFISVVFGETRFFKPLTKALILELHPRQAGENTVQRRGGDKEICVEDLPNKLYDDITRERDAIVWKLRSLAKEYMTEIQKPKEPSSKKTNLTSSSLSKLNRSKSGKNLDEGKFKLPRKHGRPSKTDNSIVLPSPASETITSPKLQLDCSCTTSSYSSFILQTKTEKIWTFLFQDEKEGGTDVELPDVCIMELCDGLVRSLKKAMMFTGMCLRTRKKCDLKEFLGELIEKVEKSLDDVKGFEAEGYIQIHKRG